MSQWKGIQFSVGGIPVLVRPMFFLFTIVFGASLGSAPMVAIWLGIVFVSILVHELGHAAMMRAFGFSPSVELVALGGFTSWSLEKKPTPGQRLLVTFCGPGAGLVLGGLITLVRTQLPADADPLLAWAVKQAQFVNIAWSLVNLMPVLPWDGGLIVDSAVELIGKKPRPKVAGVLSLLIGGAIAIFALTQQQILLVYFGGMGVWRGWLTLSPPRARAGEELWALMHAQKFAEAERAALEQIVATPDPEERAGLYELIAWSRLLRDNWAGVDAAIASMNGVRPSRHLAAAIAAHAGRHDEVLALLTPLPTNPSEIALRTDSLIALRRFEAVLDDAIAVLARTADPEQRRSVQLIFARLFEAGAWEPSLQVALSAFGAHRDPAHLFNAACAQVKLGQADQALASLQRAVEAGFSDRKSLLEDPDLAALRQHAGWSSFAARLA